MAPEGSLLGPVEVAQSEESLFTPDFVLLMHQAFLMKHGRWSISGGTLCARPTSGGPS